MNIHSNTIYAVSVDYSKSVEEMIIAGHYDWHNDNINSTNFPLVPPINQLVGPNLGPYRTSGNNSYEKIVVELVHLNKTVSSEDVLTYFEKNYLRSATLPELLAFGATYPEVQREFSVVALGSFWIGSDNVCRVPRLCRYLSERGLNYSWYVHDWHGNYRFLAVRK